MMSMNVNEETLKFRKAIADTRAKGIACTALVVAALSCPMPDPDDSLDLDDDDRLSGEYPKESPTRISQA